MARMRAGASRGRGRAQVNRAPLAEPDPLQEMLREAVRASNQEDGRTVKKRRIGGRLVIQTVSENIESDSEASIAAASVSSVPAPTPQTAYNDSDDSEDSDVAWEDVDLEDTDPKDLTVDLREEAQPSELNIVLDKDDKPKKQRSAPRRKPVTAEERKLRFEIHKLNILCLLSHVHLRNHWCNDEEVQKSLRQRLSKKTRSYLDDKEKESQFQRSRSLMEGLKDAQDMFKKAFTIDARGMARPLWAQDPERIADSDIADDIDLPIEKSDFQNMARKLSASRDVGAQLFCSMIRSTGTEARLVVSLQVLPITATAKGTTPVKSKPTMIVSYPETRVGMGADDDDAEIPSKDLSEAIKSGSDDWRAGQVRAKIATRLGRDLTSNRSSTSEPQRRPKPKKKRIRESAFPVYWVEVFNAAYQKWVPIDPLVTYTIGKPSKLEPPASDLQNNLVYAVAFEEDGSARDVTRRYAKAYNAKTRKLRVESTKDGEKWWKRVMSVYGKSYDLDRDQVEDAELSQKEAQEPMPTNVQDFKNHPYYALERHIKRNEVIHPKRQVGKVSTGKGGLDSDKNVEPIFRRRDVHIVKSADSWYRLGREVQVGEQPLKVVLPRTRKTATASDDERSDTEENAGTAMYAGFQTSTYRAPPVVGDRVPRNEYGNLDVYVASMVPPGGAHVVHADAPRAARLVGIDYADAVTGFQFKGRHGTAITKGAVVAAQFADAVVEVIKGYDYERAEAEDLRRSMKALRLWRRFLAGLRIRERIQGYAPDNEENDIQEQLDDDEEAEQDDGGGFLPDREEVATARPTGASGLQDRADESSRIGTGKDLISRQTLDEDLPHTFVEPQVIYGPSIPKNQTLDRQLQNIEHEEGGFMPEHGTRDSMMEDQEGSFIMEEDSGGFMPEIDTSDQVPRNDRFKALKSEESRELDSLFNSQDDDDDDEEQIVVMEESTNSIILEKAVQEGDITPTKAADTSNDSGLLAGTASGDDSDSGSLLSHDPEDEDADPEWLE